MRDKITELVDKTMLSKKRKSELIESLLVLFDVSESLPSDDEIKLTDNGFGALEKAINKAKGNVH